MSADFDPIEVLKEDLQDESTEVQLEAVKALNTIALALGPERTANDLFSYLDKYCFPVEVQASQSPEAYSNTDALNAKEEVLAAIAAQLGPEFIQYCGGSRAVGQNLLPFLERLSVVEETVIRSAATESMNKILGGMDKDDVRIFGLPILTRLIEGDWFTSRVSASSLTPQFYKLLTSEEQRKTVLDAHKKLCDDEMPMVKNDAYKNLVPLIENLEKTQILPNIKPLLQQLTSELTENMRQSIVDICKKIAERSDEEKAQDVVCQFMKAAVEDESWRVRKHAAVELPIICTHLSKTRVIKEIIPLYISLLSDVEPQVRKSGIYTLTKMLNITDGNAVALRLTDGCIQQLAQDNTPEVREVLAEELSFLGQQLTNAQVKERLLPVMKRLASDESHQARLNLCSKLSDLSDMLGIEIFETEILPLLKEMTVDQKWRVRNSIVTNIAHIGIKMGKDKFGKSRLKEILIQSMRDPAATVRQSVVEQIQKLHAELGYEWMTQHIFPPMKRVFEESGNYLHRMLPLKAIGLMAPNLTGAQLSSEFIEILHKGLDDDISNVRFTACRVLKEVVPRIGPNIVAQFRTKLEKLLEDTDSDVKYFAAQTLSVC